MFDGDSFEEILDNRAAGDLDESRSSASSPAACSR